MNRLEALAKALNDHLSGDDHPLILFLPMIINIPRCLIIHHRVLLFSFSADS